MDYRTLELNLISAKEIKKIGFLVKMDVFAVVSVSGGANAAKQKTPVNSSGDTNPTWNHPMKFTLEEALIQQNRLTVVVRLRCQRTFGDKDIGEVNVPVKELLEGSGEGQPLKFVMYQVRKPSGKPKGVINFSYKFGEVFVGGKPAAKVPEPVTAYPAPGPMAGTSSAYPPPQAYMGQGPGPYPPPAGYPYPPPVAGYGYQPQPGYGGYPPQQVPPGYGGYPPQQGYPPQAGYGYPPVQQQQQAPKKNKFGLGLGAGLLGGALGGLLIGDMVSDGFDGGFDDGGFDGGF
ncbi:hypothetical protein RJ639_012707 [Escallonia herrerae]|uniref:C2 domain-containing protein n=1 Tax=Escallonia herrerae TaxID=1293975 RepID=A0AA88VMV3_9ASTE|nr:hypothetical protein RJ639_012707 [Escallonia herrerae]